MIKKQEIKAIAIKSYKNQRKISLLNKKKENYNNYITNINYNLNLFNKKNLFFIIIFIRLKKIF